MNDLFFELQQLRHQYADGTIALNNLSLQIPKGQKVALLGHNGAGKSTLIQHLNGLLKPSSGTIIFNGQPMTYSQKALQTIRQQVGIVFQDSNAQLFSGTVKKDIAFGPLNLGWAIDKINERVNWAMEQTGITDLQNKPIHFLSVGQKKRVAIAGVLAMEPSVMILDEPTAGLDPYYTRQLMALLSKWHNNNRTIILSTHDIQLAYEWADTMVVMHEGQIVYNGNATDLFAEQAILQRVHIERPWAYDVALALQEKQIIPKNESLPRTTQQILEAIRNHN